MKKMSMYRHDVISPLGTITLASDGEALTGLWFEGQKHFGTTLAEGAEEASLPVFDATAEWLSVYFAGQLPKTEVPVRLLGTSFSCAVWEELRKIPYGRTVTYGELARTLGKESAVRAVAGAVARNPVSILVPCHRVLGKDGALTGYAGGLDRKERLLFLEQGK